MCGIAGLIGPAANRQIVETGLARLAHRGPDGTGIWQGEGGVLCATASCQSGLVRNGHAAGLVISSDHNPASVSDPSSGGDISIVLGATRLATTDTRSSASQPMHSDDGRFVLVFNGYLAGHRRQMAAFARAGRVFRTASDTELFLMLVSDALRAGQDLACAIAGLSGQFAFALWDRECGRLWLGRDPMGIKPLYVAVLPDGNLAFASEAGALAAMMASVVSKTPDLGKEMLSQATPDLLPRLLPEHAPSYSQSQSQSHPLPDRVKAAYLAHLFIPAPFCSVPGAAQIMQGDILCWQGGEFDGALSHITRQTDWSDGWQSGQIPGLSAPYGTADDNGAGRSHRAYQAYQAYQTGEIRFDAAGFGMPGHPSGQADAAPCQTAMPGGNGGALGKSGAIVNALRNAARQSVADAMDADRPVGLLLSGGVDSGGIAGLAANIARENGQNPPMAFCMQIPGKEQDETPRARMLADHLGMPLSVVAAPREAADVYTHLRHGLVAMGGPFGNPSLVLMQALSAHVATQVPVCLAGDGGDELFGGYPRYRAANWYGYWRHVPAPIRAGMAAMFRKAVQVQGNRPSIGPVAGQFMGRVVERAGRFFDGASGDGSHAFDLWNNRGMVPGSGRLMAGRFGDGGPGGDVLARMMDFDRAITLPGNQLAMSDRCGMAHGLEYRVPMLGCDVVEIARSVPGRMHLKWGGKTLWRQAVAPFLPAGYGDGPKVGFNPLLGIWLPELARLLFGDDRQIVAALFADMPVTHAQGQAYWQAAISGRAPDMARSIWALMVWHIWCDMAGQDAGLAPAHTA